MKLVCFGLKCVMKDTYHHIHVMKGCLLTSLFCFQVWHLLQARRINSHHWNPTPKGRFRTGKSCPKNDWTSSNIKNCLEILGEWLLNSEVIDWSNCKGFFNDLNEASQRPFCCSVESSVLQTNELSTYLLDQACLWCGCLAEDLDRRFFFAKPLESPWICCFFDSPPVCFAWKIRWDIGMMNRWHTQSYFVAMVK